MNTKKDITSNAVELFRSFAQAVVFVIGGFLMCIGILLGLLWYAIVEGMEVGMDVADTVIDFVDPIDEEDEQ